MSNCDLEKKMTDQRHVVRHYKNKGTVVMAGTYEEANDWRNAENMRLGRDWYFVEEEDFR